MESLGGGGIGCVARRGARLLATVGVVGGLLAISAPAHAATTGTTDTRYSLVHGCFALKPASGGKLIAQTGNGYTASAGAVGDAEPFRMQATDLGRYLFYGQAQDFLGLDSGSLAQDDVIAATAPSGRSDWTVDGAHGDFTIVNDGSHLALAMSGNDVVAVPEGQAQAFTFIPADGCAVYPEIELNDSGRPNTSKPRYGEVEGTVDGHMHMMAFEFLGRQAHCGEPWDKFGAPYALKDCADHIATNGCGAILETFLGGNPCHDTGGWPNFGGWPAPHSLTHEDAYYRWLERAHDGGLRIFVNLMVENRVLCEAYPVIPVSDKQKSNCDEMDSVQREIKDIHKLQDYVDAQEGGPGQGWFRIVKNPFQARKVISKGKLAVVQGLEVSEPFDCGYKGALDPPASPVPDPRCSKAHISDWLNQLHDLGLRQFEITNKFDNQLTGVAGDGGSTGVVVNGGQLLTSGHSWDFGPYIGTCNADNHDRIPSTGGAPVSQDSIFGNGLSQLGIPSILPVYGPNDKCNQAGLTDLGAYAINQIIDRKMIFDPDHMSEYARGQALDLVESRDYSGIVSSHSWSTSSTLPRIYALGGMVTPYGGDSSSFVHDWEELRADRPALGDQYFGVGYGADANGFGAQGDPRNPAPEAAVNYPFTGLDGAMTFDQQHSGTAAEGRTYDINTDGVSHYGLYPDWLQDLHQIAGDDISRDMDRGAEAYLQMWERAKGIPAVDCSQWGDEDFNPKGLGTELRLNHKPKNTLRRAGQPVTREKTWRWCAGGGGRNSAENVTAAFGKRNKMNFAISNLPEHAIDGVGPGDPKSQLGSVGKKISKQVWISRTGGRRAYVWIVGDNGTVSHTGAVSQSAARHLNSLAKRLVKAAG